VGEEGGQLPRLPSSGPWPHRVSYVRGSRIGSKVDRRVPSAREELGELLNLNAYRIAVA
jgi:hypothetical protein